MRGGRCVPRSLGTERAEGRENRLAVPQWEARHLARKAFLGHTPSTAGAFRKKFPKDSGKNAETLSERFLEFPSRVRLGSPKPYFQNSLPPSTAGDASFFRSGSGEGLPEPVMEFSAVLGVSLIFEAQKFVLTIGLMIYSTEKFYANLTPA